MQIDIAIYVKLAILLVENDIILKFTQSLHWHLLYDP